MENKFDFKCFTVGLSGVLVIMLGFICYFIAGHIYDIETIDKFDRRATILIVIGIMMVFINIVKHIIGSGENSNKTDSKRIY